MGLNFLETILQIPFFGNPRYCRDHWTRCRAGVNNFGVNRTDFFPNGEERSVSSYARREAAFGYQLGNSGQCGVLALASLIDTEVLSNIVANPMWYNVDERKAGLLYQLVSTLPAPWASTKWAMLARFPQGVGMSGRKGLPKKKESGKAHGLH